MSGTGSNRPKTTGWLEWIAAIADRETDGQAARQRHRVLVFMGLLMSMGGLVWGTAFLATGLWLPAVIPFLYPVVTAANFTYLRATNNFPLARLVQILASLLLPFSLQWSLGGFASSGVVMLWAMMALIGGTVTTEGRGGARWLVPFVLLTTFSAVVDPYLPEDFAALTNDTVRTVLLVANITVPTTCVFVLTVYLLSAREAATQDLEKANVALGHAMEEAGAASRAKSAFVADMSHEIRTPLNGVVGLLEVLERTELDATQRDYVRTMRGSADALMAIVNQILDFSSLSARAGTLQCGPVDAMAIAEDVVARLAVRAHQRGVELGVVLDLEPGASLPDVVAEPNALTQVLTNLVGNAIKFTSRGSITVRVSRVADATRIEVEDTGPGIAPTVLATLFDPFVTVSPEEPSRVGSAGTGLGLAIGKRLTEEMGGTLTVTSELGRGSTFVVTLACAAEVPSSAPAPAERAWIVASPSLATRALGVQLARLGVRARSIEPEALAALEPAPGDPVFVDVSRLEQVQARLAASEHHGLVVTLGKLGDVESRPTAANVRVLHVPTTRKRLLDLLTGAHDAPKLERVVRRDLRVLVVEDNPVNRLVLRALLEALGCEMVEVEDGQQAIERTETERYDVILMDCQMPVMDGYEASRAIRAREAARGTRRTPILALTAHVGPEHERATREAGMDAHLTKPVRLGTLEAALAPFLSRPPTPHGGIARREVLAALALPDALVDEATTRELRELGDAAFLAPMHEELCALMTRACAQLREGLCAEPIDRTRSAAIAHRLAGSLVTLGAQRMGRLAKKLEARFADAELAELSSLCTQLEELREPTARAVAVALGLAA